MPDTIFSVDFDEHIDHRGTSLLFEEAMCNLLSLYPNYHPTVYKGFCYGTAWTAADDFYNSINLLSTKKPTDDIWDNSAFGYSWEDRIRFPINNANLNFTLSKTSAYQTLELYFSQIAYKKPGGF